MIIRIPYHPRGHDFIDPQDFPSYASTSKKQMIVKDSLFSPACQSEKVHHDFSLDIRSRILYRLPYEQT